MSNFSFPFQNTGGQRDNLELLLHLIFSVIKKATGLEGKEKN